MDEGGDWDRRNRLRIYEGLNAMSLRNFGVATKHFLEGMSTFTAYELMSYDQFITYTVLSSVLSLGRMELRKSVVRSPEVLEALHHLPAVSAYLNAFFECRYADFFRALASVESMLKTDRHLFRHCRYYVNEMRIRAYAQLLESYRSVTLVSMAALFGVSVDFLDQYVARTRDRDDACSAVRTDRARRRRDLARFIAAGRLSCKIDRVGGTIETNRPDNKNRQYQNVIKQGDVLLNRVQKLLKKL